MQVPHSQLVRFSSQARVPLWRSESLQPTEIVVLQHIHALQGRTSRVSDQGLLYFLVHLPYFR